MKKSSVSRGTPAARSARPPPRADKAPNAAPAGGAPAGAGGGGGRGGWSGPFPPLRGGAGRGGGGGVGAGVGGFFERRGARGGVSLGAPADALPGGQHRLLDGVLGVGEGSEHPVAVLLQLPPVRPGQLPERLAIPGPRPRQKIGCHHPALLPSRTPSYLRPGYTPPPARTGRLPGAQ